MSTEIPSVTATAQARDIEITCCLNCCPTWWTRARTPKEPTSPPGFADKPHLKPLAEAIVKEVHKQREEERRTSMTEATALKVHAVAIKTTTN